MKYLILIAIILSQIAVLATGTDLVAEYYKNIITLKGEPKSQAIIELGKLSDPRAIQRISEYAKDPTDSAIRAAAVTATQWIRTESSYNIAFEALSDPSEEVKIAAIQSLNVITDELHGWKYPGNESIEAIINIYNNCKEINLKLSALSFLTSKTHPGINAIVSSAIDDNNQNIRLVAISSPLLQRNINKLISLTGDKNSDLKAALANIAGNMKSQQGFNILKELIKDINPQVKTAALQSLSNYNNNESKEILLAMQEHHDFVIASQAILSSAELGYISSDILQKRFSTEKELLIKMAIINAMRKYDDKTTTTFLINLLKKAKKEFPDNTTPVIKIITEILLDKCKEITPELMELMNSDIYEVRLSLAVILGKIKSADSIELLKKLYNDDEISIRTSVVNSLGEINSPLSCETLLILLKERVPSVKISIIRNLAKCKYKPANDKLIVLSNDDNTPVAVEAVTALGLINSKSTTITATLLNIYKKAPMPVQTAVIYALGNTEDKRISKYLRDFFIDAPREMMIAIILTSGKIHDEWIISAITTLMKGSYQFDIEIKKASAEALSNFNNEEAIQLLNFFIYNPIPVVRHAAISSLSTKDNINAKIILSNIVYNTQADYSDRASALSALNARTDEKAIQICKDIVRLENNPQIKLSALTALVNNNEKNLAIINDWQLKTNNPELITILESLKQKVK